MDAGRTSVAHAMKRADLPTGAVLIAVRDYGFRAWDVMVAWYPPALVRAAILRDVRAGWLDYGVAVERPWLTRDPSPVLMRSTCEP